MRTRGARLLPQTQPNGLERLGGFPGAAEVGVATGAGVAGGLLDGALVALVALVALAAPAAAAASDDFGAGEDGCGNAYSANTAGRLATSLSVVAVDANSNRCGGSVGATVGTPGTPLAPGLAGGPLAPGAPGPETRVALDTVGVALGAPDAAGLADPLAPGTGGMVRVIAGGGVETVSISATARR